MEIYRGRVLSYDSTNHKADVVLAGSMSGVVLGVPVAHHVGPEVMTADRDCGVMFFGEGDAGAVVCTFDGTPFNAVKDLDFDAKGDLLVGKGSDDYDRLAVGSNGEVLTADSGETLGLKWAVPVPTVPACRVYHSAGQSTVNGGWTVLLFNSERYDTDGIHSTASNTERLTAQTEGVYDIKGSARWANSNTGARGLQLMHSVSGSIAVIMTPNAAVGYDFLMIATDFYMNVGEYVYIRAYQLSGGALNVDAASNYSPELMMVKVD